jgi:hypothetical protein
MGFLFLSALFRGERKHVPAHFLVGMGLKSVT